MENWEFEKNNFFLVSIGIIIKSSELWESEKERKSIFFVYPIRCRENCFFFHLVPGLIFFLFCLFFVDCSLVGILDWIFFFHGRAFELFLGKFFISLLAAAQVVWCYYGLLLKCHLTIMTIKVYLILWTYLTGSKFDCIWFSVLKSSMNKNGYKLSFH